MRVSVQAEAKGVSSTEYGLIFGVFALGQLLCYPLAARMVPVLTAKWSIVGGMFLTSVCTTGFAYLQWCPEGWPFFWTAFLLRLVSAVGVAFSLTAILTFSLSRFKEHITVVAVSHLNKYTFGFTTDLCDLLLIPDSL